MALICLSAQAAEGWLTDIEEAVAKAKKENKAGMVKLTGSDWCPPCQQIQKAVFDKKLFVDGVKDKFVLCIIDLPRGDKELNQKNKPVAEKYKISGFPTVILMDEAGKEFTRYNPTSYMQVKEMIDHMNYELRRKDMF